MRLVSFVVHAAAAVLLVPLVWRIVVDVGEIVEALYEIYVTHGNY